MPKLLADKVDTLSLTHPVDGYGFRLSNVVAVGPLLSAVAGGDEGGPEVDEDARGAVVCAAGPI